MRVSKRLQATGDNFADLVTEYCDLIDSHKDYAVVTFLIKIERVLSQLYSAAAALPIVDLPAKLINQRFNETLKAMKQPSPARKRSAFHARYARLSKYLGKYNTYLEIFDPTDNTDLTPTHYSIAGDLAEIYDDIKAHLAGWQKGNGTEKNEAISHWQLNWDLHWSHHTLSGLKAIHNYLEKHFADTDEDEMKTRNNA